MIRKLFMLATSLIIFAGDALSSDLIPKRASVFELQLPSEPVAQLEQVYLHEFTATIMETARHYALITGSAPDLKLEMLQKFDRCQPLFTALQPSRDELHSITEQDKIDPTAYFEHLITLSLALTHMNRKLYKLGKARDTLEKDFMRSVADKDEVQEKIKELDDKIEVIDRKMDAIFVADPANMLLTIKVGEQKQPLYQKIVSDYYHLLSMDIVGVRLIETIQETNQPLLEDAWQHITTRNRKFLHQAWQHTCGKHRLRWLWRPSKFARLGFYIKHRSLVERIEALLTEKKHNNLLNLQKEAQNYFEKRLSPEHFHSSATSSIGMLAALTVPAFIAGRAYNHITLPLIGTAGVLYSGYRTKALYDMRRQLETGALSGLNSYNLYHDFYRNTSLSRTAFSHLSVTALAWVLRRVPKTPSSITNVDSKLLVAVSIVGSLFSMFVTEAAQTGNINFLKDRDFLYNLFVVATIDGAVSWIASLALAYESKVALTAAASALLSFSGHVLSGKPMNWDRIIFDTTFISTYSLFKANYFYTNGTRMFIRKLNEKGISRMGTNTAVASAMSLISNFLGNVPYAIVARNWVERRPDYHKFPLPKNQRGDKLEDIDLAQHLDQLLAKHGLEDKELKKTLRQLLINMPASDMDD